MFKRLTDSYFALGIVLGGTIVAVLFLFGQAIYDLAKCNHDGQCNRYAAQYNGEDFPSSWWWFWDGSFVSASDTLAQWIMAFFTIAVVLLVWRTLIATQEMARETTRIGEAQVRAYVSISKVENIHVTAGENIALNISISNSGASPAKSVAYVAIPHLVAPSAIEKAKSPDLSILQQGSEIASHSNARCSIPDDHISPRRSALFMARSALRELRDGEPPC